MAQPTLATIEDLVAKVLEPERGVVRASFGGLGDTRVDDLADEDRVVAHLHRRLERALDVGRSVGEDGRARRARPVRLAGDGLVLFLGWLEERVGHRLLA